MPATDISNFNTCADLKSAPINPSWIVEGAPIARNCKVAGSSDRSAWTMLWDCTAGKFHWIYDVDETVHVLEGSVTITADGKIKTLRAGDIAFFPAGSVALWHVENHVRKLAFCQKPLPATLGVPLRLMRRVLSLFHESTALMQHSLREPLLEDDAQHSPQDASRVPMESRIH